MQKKQLQNICTKLAEARGNLIGNKITVRIRNETEKSSKVRIFFINKNYLVKDIKHQKSVKKLLMNFG